MENAFLSVCEPTLTKRYVTPRGCTYGTMVTTLIGKRERRITTYYAPLKGAKTPHYLQTPVLLLKYLNLL